MRSGTPPLRGRLGRAFGGMAAGARTPGDALNSRAGD